MRQGQDIVQTLSFKSIDEGSKTASISSTLGKSVDNQTPSSGGRPEPLPRISSPKKNETPSPIGTNLFGDPDSEESIQPPSEALLNRISETLSDRSSEAGDRSSCTGRSEDSNDEEVGKDNEEDLHDHANGSFNCKQGDDSPSESYYANSQGDSNTPLISPNKRTSRFWPRAKYAMQQRSFIVPVITAIFSTTYLYAYDPLTYMQNKSMFIAFVQNNPKFITVPGIIVASLFAIGIFCAIKQFNNTIEHQIQEKNPDKVLKKVLEFQPENKIIKSVRLKYSNNTHSNFTFNTWKSNKGFINIDEKVINRTNKIESVFNDRPVFTPLLTGFVVANLALPLGLYAAGGISNVTTFYQSLAATKIGLSLLVASSLLALSVLCLGVHYYNKTNCNNLVYPREHIDPEKVNKKIVGIVERIKEDALKENHGKDDKGASLTIDQVTVESYNYPTLSIACC